MHLLTERVEAPPPPPATAIIDCLYPTPVRFPQEGDEEALAVKYDCKLVYRLENEFSPYTRCDAQDVMLKLATFVVDPRFQGDSLFLKLYGDALGPVADMVKAAYNYIIKAADIKPRKVIRAVLGSGCCLRSVGGRAGPAWGAMAC